jgi:hypothetical protein
MPYKFGEYVSQYVDPKSIEIGETLHNRYMDSFKANDQLAMAVDQMQAALPFENDMMKKKELQAQLDTKLAQLADRGDFENLGFVIHKEAKDFARKYAPIKENYTRYASAMTELQESIKKGDVNEEYASLFPSYMVKGYKGFETGADGKVVAGSMYSAPTAVKDPKILDKLQKALAILKPETFKSKITGYTGEGNMYKFTTENEVIEIRKEDVQDVIDTVLAEPDVKAYVNQFSDMKAYAATKTEGAAATVASMADNYSNVLGELTAKLDDPSLKSNERVQIKNQIEVLTSEIAKVTKVSQDEKLAYEYIKNKYEDEILAPYQSYGEKAISRSESHSRSKEFSESYLKDQEWRLANSSLQVVGKVSLADKNGTTTDEKANNMRNAFAAAYALEQKLNNPDYVATLSEESLKNERAALKSYKDQALLIQQQMFSAANAAISEKDIVEASPDAWKAYTVMKELYPWAKPGEIYIRMQESFSDKTGQDYNNFQNKYTEKYGGPLTQYAAGDKQHPKITAEEYRQKYEPGKGSEVQGFSSSEPSYQMVQFFKNNPNGVYQGPIFEGFAPEGAPNEPSELTNPLNVVLKNKLESKVNNQYREIKTSTTFNYGAIDAPTTEQSKTITAALKNFFVNKPVSADFNVIDITEDGATSVSGAKLAGFEIVDVGWNMTNNIYELKLKGGTSEAPISKTVHLDGRYVRNSTLDQMLNTPENKMAGVIAEMDMHRSGEISTRPVKILGRDAYMVVESDGAGHPYIRYVDQNWQNFSGDAAVLSQKHRQDSQGLKSIVNAYNKQSESYAVEF